METSEGTSEHTVSFVVNYIPVAGSFQVEPSTGYSHQTVFKLSAPGWYDFDDDATALRY